MMKKILMIFGLTIVLCGCNIQQDEELTLDSIVAETRGEAPPDENELSYSPNEMVIRFAEENISEELKAPIRAKYERKFHFSIMQIETCSCGSDLELWTIDTSDSNFRELRDTVFNMRNTEGNDDMDGDLQFSFNAYSTPQTLPGGSPVVINSTQLSDLVVGTNHSDGVNVAIIDSGINYDFFSTDSLFLYNSVNDKNCPSEISGWDFINNDNDPYGDYWHGTAVTKLITDGLKDKNVPFQILPLKAFDENGQGTYWNVVCAFDFVKRKPDIDLVNASFGWDFKDNDNVKQIILKKIINEMSDRTLVLASVGNSGKNIDNPLKRHFPASYINENILTTGGFDSETVGEIGTDHLISTFSANLDARSNFGKIGVDLLASYGPYRIDLTNYNSLLNGYIIMSGTSFSCTQTTVRAVELFHQTSGIPIDVRNAVEASGYTANNLQNYISTSKVLLSTINNQ